jgi:hypothetical protein
MGNAGLRGLAGVVRDLGEFCCVEFRAAAVRLWRRGSVRCGRRAGGDHRAIAPRAGQFPAQPVLRRAGARHPGVRLDRTLRAAGVRTRLMVGRVVGAHSARDRDDHPAAADAVRYTCAQRRNHVVEIRRPADPDLSRRLFSVRRRLYRLHDLHDRLCPRFRRRCGGAERVLEPDRAERIHHALGVARRAGARPRRRLDCDHSFRQRRRRGAAAARAFDAVAGAFGAGVRRRILCRGRIDHRLRALQLSAGRMAEGNRGHDDCIRHRPDPRADRGWRHHRRAGQPVLRPQRLGGDAGGGGCCGGVSGKTGAKIVRTVRVWYSQGHSRHRWSPRR